MLCAYFVVSIKPRLRLDDSPPIAHWQRAGDPRGEITLRQLLQMRSGLRHEEKAERADFTYDHRRDLYTCPGGRELHPRRKIYRSERPLVDEDGMMRYRASKFDCDACLLKPQCCPNTPARKIPRSIHEGARQMARDICNSDEGRTSRRERKKIEMLFAHLKRILKLDRLRLPPA